MEYYLPYTKKIANLIDRVIFLYDLKNKKIIWAVKDETVICENSDLTTFFKCVFQYENILSDYHNEVKTLEHNFNNSYSQFNINLSVINEKNESVLYEIKATIYGESAIHNKYIGTIRAIDKSTHALGPNAIDPFFKIYSKAAITKFALEEISKKNKRPLALIIVDIDHFKNFNDTYGHLFGDEVLASVFNTIRKTVGSKGYVGRIGGDELLIILFDAADYETVWDNCYEIKTVVEHLHKELSNEIKITCTIGCARYPLDGDNYETLFRKADIALYYGKTKGKNCFVIYNEDLHGPIKSDIYSVENNEFNELINTADHNHLMIKLFDFFSTEKDFNHAISKAVEAVGTYFKLDRILIILNDDEKEESNIFYEWVNPMHLEFCGLVKVNYENKKYWNFLYSKDGIFVENHLSRLKNSDVYSNRIYELLTSQQVKSILATNFKYKDKTFGQIRYDICSSKRKLQNHEINSLTMASKIISIFFTKLKDSILAEQKIFFDPLTGLYSYAKFMREAQQKLIDYPNNKFALIATNFVNFNYINDLLGFEQSDRFLKFYADILRKELLHTSTIFARIDTDRFLILTPYESDEHIISLLKSISTQLANTTEKPSVVHQLTLLGGIFITDSSINISKSIDNANLALKSLDHYCIHNYAFYNEEMSIQDLKERRIENHMITGLETGEFTIYLQPKVRINSNELVGAEALIRWNYNFKELLLPNDFIPIFEKNGFIISIDFFVFEEVCKLLTKQKENGIELIPISVNMSRMHLGNKTFVLQLEEIRKKYPIEAKYIEIEITESMFIQNYESLKIILDSLHEYGYKISIDDFGSGYSSLNLLAHLDVDILKIDRSLIQNCENEKESIILSSIIGMAKSLNIDLISEGVETIEQATTVHKMGCNLSQGYLYDQPLPYEEFKRKYKK